MHPLIYCHTRFKIVCQEDMRLPKVKNSMFRGLFGRVFKNFNCANRREKNCANCLLKNTCCYNYIFEGKLSDQSSKPYLLFCPDVYKTVFRKGETIPFELTLFGKAAAYLPHFIFTFIEIGKIGIRAEKYKYTISEVCDDKGNVVYADGQMLHQDFADKFIPIAPENPVRKIKLNFIMPLRLTNFGDLVVTPTFEMIIKALTRRLNLLARDHQAYGGEIDYKPLLEKAKGVQTSANRLVWKDWMRFSNRQHGKMAFGGLVGDIVFEGDLTPFIPYLQMGQISHIGKNCVFGNGKYILTEEL